MSAKHDKEMQAFIDHCNECVNDTLAALEDAGDDATPNTMLSVATLARLVRNGLHDVAMESVTRAIIDAAAHHGPSYEACRKSMADWIKSDAGAVYVTYQKCLSVIMSSMHSLGNTIAAAELKAAGYPADVADKIAAGEASVEELVDANLFCMSQLNDAPDNSDNEPSEPRGYRLN